MSQRCGTEGEHTGCSPSHSAVRFGDVLDLAEQRRLLTDLELAEESLTCPHGRPTRLLIDWQELTRHFRRNY